MSIATFDQDRARNYDGMIANWFPGYEEVLGGIANLLRSDAAGDEILVVGAGTGNEILALLDASPHFRITGVDPAAEMVAIAEQKLMKYPSVQMVTGTVDMLATIPRFHAATLLLVLHFLPDDGAKLDLLQAISQRLKPEAAFFLVDIFGDQTSISAQLKRLKTMLPEDVSQAEIEYRFQRIKEKIHYIPEERLQELLLEAGFGASRCFFQETIYGGWWTRKRA